MGSKLPEGWERKRLEKVAFLQRGFDLPTRKRQEGAVPIISSGGVTGTHSEVQVKAPGVVTGRYGTIGHVFFVEDDFWPLNTTLWVKDFHGNDKKYIYYLLSKVDYSKFSDKTGVPGINRNDIHRIKVPVPPPPEQTKIARILSTWDRAIETTEKLIENSRQQKKALMQQLLTGRKRLPGFKGEWKSVPIGDIGDITTGNTPSKNDPLNYGEEFLWATAEDFCQKYITDTHKKLSRKGAQQARLVPAGSVLVTCIASIGKNAITQKCLATNQQINAVTVNEDNSNEFLFYSLNHYKHKLVSLAGVTAVPIVNKSTFAKLKINLPTNLEEQVAIAAILSVEDQEIERLEKMATTLNRGKQALMQQLLTGKRRVRVDT